MVDGQLIFAKQLEVLKYEFLSNVLFSIISIKLLLSKYIENN